ncbi:hypothetical protein ACIBBB_15060 [Streptomyces sp. NPDC051217]|uniref:hypothetical protein n=1 Tax=Streptomyces sp. NPDC051217 TaxID=3365644 RepID=UPI0037B57E83
MSAEAAPPPQPYRWSLSAFGGGRPDQLGTLCPPQDQSPPGDLVLAGLTAVTAKVLARSDGADLCFLGRSLDSMYDLLTGALEHSPWDGKLLRLPVSCMDDDGWSPAAGRRFREHLASVGLEPYALARRSRPIALVDVVAQGRSYGTLHRHLADWVVESREPWTVIRRKLRYVAVTRRVRSSPNTWRWQQDPDNAWVRTLPAHHVTDVSLDRRVWTHLADDQPKVNESFPHWNWFDEPSTLTPRHHRVARALAEARYFTEAGRSTRVREELIRLMAREPGFAGREPRRIALALRTRATSRTGSGARPRSGTRARYRTGNR